jgi:hypothetical protein
VPCACRRLVADSDTDRAVAALAVAERKAADGRATSHLPLPSSSAALVRRKEASSIMEMMWRQASARISLLLLFER